MAEPEGKLFVTTEEIMPKGFHRQIALLTEAREVQKDCPHTLMPTKDVIFCIECGAFWIR